ncbi:ATP-dependent DNA ligase [Agromyces sp. MMS24-JH15]|uniref:ATP-dependent DNA ligase n=1 Tax=Agromyces sp. MMS24-JH15 TaxID=3243765 RepID=UPI0037497B6F
MAEGERRLVEVDGRTLRLTNLDKVMYPETGMTKGEVIAYYAEVAAAMVPVVAGRPITRKRWVHGVGTADAPAQPFFEKNLADHAPDWVRSERIEHSDGPKRYPIAGDRATLVWLAQLAALELHVPQWRFDPQGRPSNPDRLVFDLDPGEGMGLAECAEVARLVRDILEPIGLAPVPVTSGSKGLHLYAALTGGQTSQQASEIAHELARALEADHPDLVVSSMRKAIRAGRILIDWSQNNANKTTIAPYSLRGRSRPTVAAPRTWDELDDPALGHLEASEVLARLASGLDPFAPISRAGGEGPLAAYLAMRRAGGTPEPMPDSQWGIEAEGAPRFVIQDHHARAHHHDVRLERDGVLKSWAVPKGVPDSAGVNHLAVQTEDHPIEYLTFEGTIPTGEYGAGSMTVWDTGTYDLEKWRDDEVIATLRGMPGGPLGAVRIALIRTDGQGEKSSWLLHRMKDQRGAAAAASPVGAGAGDAPRIRTPAQPVSGQRPPGSETPAEPVASGSTAVAAAAAGAPSIGTVEARPMLASPGKPGLVGGPDWALEWKWDGIRLLARTDGGAVRLVSRSGRDETARYPELAGLATALRADALVDGELVALDDAGRPSFERLQPRMNLAGPREIAGLEASVPVRLLLFDVLEVAGMSTVDEPWERRRERLEHLVRPGSGVPVEVPALADGTPAEALEEARRLGLEGVVAKRRGSRYRPGMRSDEWVKLKLTRTQEVVVGGYRRGDERTTGRIRSLLVGIPAPDGRLEYSGRVGSGLSQQALATLAGLLIPLETDASPFVAVPAADAADAQWVRPTVVGEIEFGEWTSTGVARHPRWRGIRPDREPGEIRREP